MIEIECTMGAWINAALPLSRVTVPNEGTIMKIPMTNLLWMSQMIWSRTIYWTMFGDFWMSLENLNDLNLRPRERRPINLSTVLWF